jgi:hypothetical protein
MVHHFSSPLPILLAYTFICYLLVRYCSKAWIRIMENIRHYWKPDFQYLIKRFGEDVLSNVVVCCFILLSVFFTNNTIPTIILQLKLLYLNHLVDKMKFHYNKVWNNYCWLKCITTSIFYWFWKNIAISTPIIGVFVAVFIFL